MSLGDDGRTRIAIVSSDKCKPKKCRQECKKGCPVVRMGKMCIEVEKTSKIAFISETLCIGCGICVKKCPFDAIQIINLPKNLENDTTHRYGPNSFKLHRLPMPRPGQVLGLVGTNGIGKSTALKILAGKMKPNLGKFNSTEAPDWKEVLEHFRGSELQNYFNKILADELKAVVKPQYVDQIARVVKGSVQDVLAKKSDRDDLQHITEELELSHLLDREVENLSGGELQRFAVGVVSVQNADVYMYDEPSSYLDVKQRLRMARVVRSMLEIKHGVYCIVIEHDLSILDYLSDFICCLYGVPGAYGVVTMPSSVREGINIFLAGFIPTENLRFRDVSLNFKIAQSAEETAGTSGSSRIEYPTMTKTLVGKKNKKRTFTLHIEGGDFSTSEIIVLLGENGTGKTTFIRMLAGLLKSDEQDAAEARGEDADALGPPEMAVSFKPQKIAPSFKRSVRELLMAKIRDAWLHPQFATDVTKPMMIEGLLDQEVKFLSGGELQRVAMVLCLGTPADMYLVDEPSAYLDSEQRIVCAKVIKRFILHAKKTGFVVEHDFIMATYLADRVVVYDGQPGIECTANAPQTLLSGMNKFLRQLGITFRRDPTNYRPRINKHESVKDREQKASGQFFFLEDE